MSQVPLRQKSIQGMYYHVITHCIIEIWKMEIDKDMQVGVKFLRRNIYERNFLRLQTHFLRVERTTQKHTHTHHFFTVAQRKVFNMRQNISTDYKVCSFIQQFYGSVALLSHFDKVLALSKFTLLKCEIEVNPIAWIPRATSTGPRNPCYGINFIFAL